MIDTYYSVQLTPKISAGPRFLAHLGYEGLTGIEGVPYIMPGQRSLKQ